MNKFQKLFFVLYFVCLGIVSFDQSYLAMISMNLFISEHTKVKKYFQIEKTFSISKENKFFIPFIVSYTTILIVPLVIVYSKTDYKFTELLIVSTSYLNATLYFSIMSIYLNVISKNIRFGDKDKIKELFLSGSGILVTFSIYSIVTVSSTCILEIVVNNKSDLFLEKILTNEILYGYFFSILLSVKVFLVMSLINSFLDRQKGVN